MISKNFSRWLAPLIAFFTGGTFLLMLHPKGYVLEPVFLLYLLLWPPPSSPFAGNASVVAKAFSVADPGSAGGFAEARAAMEDKTPDRSADKCRGVPPRLHFFLLETERLKLTSIAWKWNWRERMSRPLSDITGSRNLFATSQFKYFLIRPARASDS
ncbi:MAG: hypothetical protein Q7J98_00010 [Kiritimatiellia bacterium]|nr:hypothetical protein [Kiritimatiellia bacterium]